VRVDVDDVEAPARLHAPAERIADRVIAPDRDHQRAALGDRTRRARDALVAGLGGRALDQDVPEIHHRHADEAVAVGLDVVPAVGALAVPGDGRRRVVELRVSRLAGSSGAGPLSGRDAGLGCAAVVGDAQKRHLRIEPIRIAEARHPVERSRRGVDHPCSALHGRSDT
jgi:hypothetical protein